MIEITNEVKAHELNGDKPKIARKLRIHSHWNDNKMAVLEWDGGERMTFAASDLEAAIKNAANSNRF